MIQNLKVPYYYQNQNGNVNLIKLISENQTDSSSMGVYIIEKNITQMIPCPLSMQELIMLFITNVSR